MLGGCDEPAARANDHNRPSTGTGVLGIMSPIAGGAAANLRPSKDPINAQQWSTYRKRYTCDHAHCNLRFERKSELSQHQRAHQRRYRCDLCGKAFPYPRDVQRHRKIHLQPTHTRVQPRL